MTMAIDSNANQRRTPHIHNPASCLPTDYQTLRFFYQRPPDFGQSPSAHYPVLVVGAGPVGLVTAIDLARQGLQVVLLDDDDCLSGGSRALCYAKRTLEVLDRLGCGDRVVDKGVSWNVGKVFFRDEPVYQFNLLPEEGHQRPAFVNLQQYYLEGYLHECASSYPNLDIRWKNKVTQLENSDAKVKVTVTTPEGGYTLNADYVIAADGARSPLRGMLNLESKGRIFQDRFLIADVKIKRLFRPSAGSGSILRFIRINRFSCTVKLTMYGASIFSWVGMQIRNRKKHRSASFPECVRCWETMWRSIWNG